MNVWLTSQAIEIWFSIQNTKMKHIIKKSINKCDPRDFPRNSQSCMENTLIVQLILILEIRTWQYFILIIKKNVDIKFSAHDSFLK
jgi:hypothetical protein